MFQGLTRSLAIGYVAIALFMTGDGFELTFLAKYLVDLGYAPVDSALVFSVYGFVAAIAAWSSGVVAELFGAKRVMLFGGGLWLALQLVFLGFALDSGSLPLILIIYGARAAAYPLFIYSFVVLIAQTVDRARLATAMGWYWAAYSLGIGVLGTYLPSWLIPLVGERATLWLALPWVAAGIVCCFWVAAKQQAPEPLADAPDVDASTKWRELARGATILGENRQILLIAIVRVICNLTLFGFPVIMPLYLTSSTYDGVQVFEVTQWMQLWGLMFAVTIVTNVVWVASATDSGGCARCAGTAASAPQERHSRSTTCRSGSARTFCSCRSQPFCLASPSPRSCPWEPSSRPSHLATQARRSRRTTSRPADRRSWARRSRPLSSRSAGSKASAGPTRAST